MAQQHVVPSGLVREQGVRSKVLGTVDSRGPERREVASSEASCRPCGSLWPQVCAAVENLNVLVVSTMMLRDRCQNVMRMRTGVGLLGSCCAKHAADEREREILSCAYSEI